MREQRTLSDHPDRMVVPSEHREPRDLCPDVNPLASALTRFAPASPLDSALTKNIPGGGGAPYDSLPSTVTLDFQLFPVNSFRLTQFTKNASATPLVSHTFKTKDLKPFRFIHFQKTGGVPPFSADPDSSMPVRFFARGCFLSNIRRQTSSFRSSLWYPTERQWNLT